MRQSDYPLPDYAVTLWHRGDGLMLQLPDGRSLMLPLGKLETDAVPIPGGKMRAPNMLGWKFLMSVLSERRSNYQKEKPSVIGTAASPTIQQLEEALKSYHEKQERDKSVDEDIFAETDAEADNG